MNSETPIYTLSLPADFDMYAHEVAAKGWFCEATLFVSDQEFKICFYDLVRLSQEIASEFERDSAFFEANLVVIPTVNLNEMRKAAAYLAARSEHLVPVRRN